MDDKLSNFWQFRVDHGNQRCIYMCEVGRRHLGLDYRPCQESLPSKNVFVEELHHYILDVCNIHLIHNPINTLPQQLPHQLLIVQAVGVFLLQHLLLHGSQLMWWHVHTSSSSRVVNLFVLIVLDGKKVRLFLQSPCHIFSFFLHHI